MDYSVFAQANPGTDYPAKDALLRGQLSLDSDKVDSAATGYAFGYKRNTTAGLNVGYYGGVIASGGALTAIADGTHALTASQTNYVERTAAGIVSHTTSSFTAGKIPMFTAVTNSTDVTAVTDERQRNVFGDLVAVGNLAVTGTGTFTGALSPLALLDLSGAGAGQIKFPASQNASADANTFDDYEKGTWTPVAVFSVGAGNLAQNTQIGNYTKIGRDVSCQMVLAFGETTASGNLSITGLPFAAKSGAGAYENLSLSFDNMTGISGGGYGSVAPGASAIVITCGGTGVQTSVTNAMTGNPSSVSGNFFYFT